LRCAAQDGTRFTCSDESRCKHLQLYALQYGAHELALQRDQLKTSKVIRLSNYLRRNSRQQHSHANAYLMRMLRHQHANDLPCHHMAKVLAFYFRLLPCQPRATLKTKIDGGLGGPPFIEVRILRVRIGPEATRASIPKQAFSIAFAVNSASDGTRNAQSHLTAAP
jgi:hypothetical protein